MLGLLEKDFNSVILNMSKALKEMISKKRKESFRTMSQMISIKR